MTIDRYRLSKILARVVEIIDSNRSFADVNREVGRLRVFATYSTDGTRRYWKGELAAHRMVADILDMEKDDDRSN